MLTPKYIRENLDAVVAACVRRNFNFDQATFTKLESERTTLIQVTEDKKSKRNAVSKAIGQLKSQGKKLPSDQVEEMKKIGEEITAHDTRLAEVLLELEQFCLNIPNLVTERVPDGKDENDNVVLQKVGDPRKFDFTPKDHTEILEMNNWSDFPHAREIAGARFSILCGDAALLDRALATFFLTENIKAGYREYRTPVLAREQALYHTGQLPKFEEDLFRIGDSFKELLLISTAEIPLTNLHAKEILNPEDLPLRYTAHTQCFRSEAGSAGKDTKGLIRLHEFSKVELVEITLPEESEVAHARMIAQAEKLLQLLELPYQCVQLCAGDIGFAARECIDVEVWLPAQNTYREVSSCSNCGAFQAGRGKIRYRTPEGKTELVHTLNGSALPIGRIMVAILENHQLPDGRVQIPQALIPYVGREILG